MIVDYETVASQEAMRAIYNEYLWPMPPIKGVKWFYPKHDIVVIDSMAFVESPTFYIQQFGRALRPKFVEPLPTSKRKLHPRQPKPSLRDLYRNKSRGRR